MSVRNHRNNQHNLDYFLLPTFKPFKNEPEIYLDEFYADSKKRSPGA
ncbi:hypothetical protein DET48_1609 [Vibrio diazotrophicus]|uniref:Uncharacterized protein n=1 Tax=Vibrio diazotrophicus TaxID=685 RepID=A0A329DTT1_VIBDI|nr:hypothetical protein DET48_1609 [Vibrio diazotrophicus]